MGGGDIQLFIMLPQTPHPGARQQLWILRPVIHGPCVWSTGIYYLYVLTWGVQDAALPSPFVTPLPR